MRIVLFVRSYWPAVGGVEKYVAELARALVQLGHQVVVIAGAHEEGLPERETHEGIEIRRFPAHRSPLRCMAVLTSWAMLFRRADVVHISDPLMFEYFERMLGWFVRPRSLCLTVHGMSCVHPVPEHEKARVRRARKLVDTMVHDGAFIGRWLDVRPDVIAPQGLRPTAAEIPTAPEPVEPSAVYVGRLSPDTGVMLYLDAIRVLRAQWGLELPLHVYGGGPLEKALREQAATDNIPVTFHGSIPNAQDRISEHMLAFVSGRMTIHEAMARRRAVIASYCNPVREDYVQGEAFSPHILTGGSGEELAQHAHNMITNCGSRIALVERAWRHVTELSWERTARTYIRLWRSPSRRESPRSRIGSATRAVALWRSALARQKKETTAAGNC